MIDLTRDTVQRLETERLRPPPRDLDRTSELFRELLDVIAAECRRAGYLPRGGPDVG